METAGLEIVLFGCLVLVAGTEPGAWNSLSAQHLTPAADLLWLFHHFYLGGRVSLSYPG